MALIFKQQAFVREYLVHGNASKAAVNAGYSRRSSRELGRRLLANPEVAAAIEQGRRALTKKAEVTAESVIEEYVKLAFADMATYVTWGPEGVRLKASPELPPGASAGVMEVSEITTKEGGTVRFKLHDKKGALDSLAKYFGIAIERRENLNWNVGVDRPPEGTTLPHLDMAIRLIRLGVNRENLEAELDKMEGVVHGKVRELEPAPSTSEEAEDIEEP